MHRWGSPPPRHLRGRSSKQLIRRERSRWLLAWPPQRERIRQPRSACIRRSPLRARFAPNRYAPCNGRPAIVRKVAIPWRARASPPACPRLSGRRIVRAKPSSAAPIIAPVCAASTVPATARCRAASPLIRASSSAWSCSTRWRRLVSSLIRASSVELANIIRRWIVETNAD